MRNVFFVRKSNIWSVQKLRAEIESLTSISGKKINLFLGGPSEINISPDFKRIFLAVHNFQKGEGIDWQPSKFFSK